MKSRLVSSRLALPFAAAAAALLASAIAAAAMPVAGSTAITADSAIVQVVQKKKPEKSGVDRSVDSGTVPARYRSRAPSEYQ